MQQYGYKLVKTGTGNGIRISDSTDYSSYLWICIAIIIFFLLFRYIIYTPVVRCGNIKLYDNQVEQFTNQTDPMSEKYNKLKNKKNV